MHTHMPLIHILLCRHVYILCVYSIPNTVQIQYFFFIRTYLLKLYSLKNIFYILKNGLQNKLYECTHLSKKTGSRQAHKNVVDRSQLFTMCTI